MADETLISMKQLISVLFIVLAGLTWFGSGIYGLVLSMKIIDGYFGFIGLVVSWVFFPMVYTFVSLYEGVIHSSWFPAQVVYGGLFSALVLGMIGGSLKESKI